MYTTITTYTTTGSIIITIIMINIIIIKMKKKANDRICNKEKNKTEKASVTAVKDDKQQQHSSTGRLGLNL